MSRQPRITKISKELLEKATTVQAVKQIMKDETVIYAISFIYNGVLSYLYSKEGFLKFDSYEDAVKYVRRHKGKDFPVDLREVKQS